MNHAKQAAAAFGISEVSVWNDWSAFACRVHNLNVARQPFRLVYVAPSTLGRVAESAAAGAAGASRINTRCVSRYRRFSSPYRNGLDPPKLVTLIAMAFLVARLVCFLVFVLFEVSFLAMVQLMRMVTLAFAHALLVSLVFRVILVVILEWSCHGLRRASTDNHARRNRENQSTAS